MKQFRRLRSDQQGVGAVEFAMIAPLLILFIIGVAQLGKLYVANAGLRAAVAEGARLATIAPRPSNEAIINRINSHRVGLVSQHIGGPTVTQSPANDSLTINMTYAVPLNFIFFTVTPVTLSETRVVHTVIPPAAPVAPAPAPAT